jgi:hypothetical protein
MDQRQLQIEGWWFRFWARPGRSQPHGVRRTRILTDSQSAPFRGSRRASDERFQAP